MKISLELQQLILSNQQTVDYIIQKSKSLSGLAGFGSVKNEKDLPVLKFNDVIKEYNKGISEDEIKAWVWYKSSLPLNKGGERFENGWEKYKKISQSDLSNFVRNGVLFYLNGTLLPYPVYAFGNIYERESQLEKDKQTIIDQYGKTAYEKHVSTLASVKPAKLSVLNPDYRERPKILAISTFAKKFCVPNLRDEYELDGYDDFQTGYYESFANHHQQDATLQKWFIEWLTILSNKEKSAFDQVSAYEIRNYYIYGMNLGRYMSDAQKETIIQYAPLEGEKLFERFLHEALTIEDQQKLDIEWNLRFNGWSNIPYNRIPVGFECSAIFKTSPLQISPIQREGIAFMKAAGSGVIAYDVGVGKTMAAIVTLANDMYSGKCQRPLICVPNAVYEKWKREIVGYKDESGQFVAGVLSNTGLVINDFHNLGTNVLKRLAKEGYLTEDKFGMLNFKNIPENSITMVTYEGLQKIGFGGSVMEDLFIHLAEILAQKGAGKSQRDVEKEIQGYREMVGVGNKGSIVDIEQLGIDYICIDEAHNFKNVFKYTPTDEEGNKRFKIESAQSARAVKAFFICNYIQKTFGSNVMLLTATPFTNNPLEIFSVLSLVGYHDMQRMGIANLYNFMETFILQTMEYVNNYDGTVVKKNVVKSFNNRLILQKLIFNKINYKTGEEAGVKRPCKINLPKMFYTDENNNIKRIPKDEQLVTFLQMTPEQRQNQDYIESLAQSGQNAAERMANVMRSLALSLDNAISPYIFKKQMTEDYRKFVDESPKIKYICECIRSVKNYHEEYLSEPTSGQVIYMNRGKEFFKLIKKYLENEIGYKHGIKWKGSTIDEVEIITSEIKSDDREYIKEAFLQGVCKIIIGTATIREGIDLQRNGTVLYNCYPDWNPTDTKQLEGRIWRQGNMFGYVRIVMPLVQDSMDVFVFQKLEEKTARVNDVFYRADRGNVLDIEALDPEEVKFALYTDLNQLAKIVIEREEKSIKRSITAVNDNIKAIQELVYSLRELNSNRDKVKQQMLDAKIKLQMFPEFVKMFPEKWDYPESKLNEYKERAVEYLKEIELYQENPNDKDLIAIFNKLKQTIFRLNGVISLSEWEFNEFKSHFSIVEKGRKTVLEAKGYSENIDFAIVIEEMKAEIEKHNKSLEELHSPERKLEIMKEIQMKKSQNKVEGYSPEITAMDFMKLNYLLQYKFTEIDSEGCALPTANDKEAIKKIEQKQASDIEKSGKRLRSGIVLSKLLKELMPDMQQEYLSELDPEGVEELQPVIDKIESQVANLKRSQSKEKEPIVYAHYFYGQSDWFVTEYEGDRIIFGYAILNGDVQFSEWGTASVQEMSEIRKHGGVQMDFYWTPVPINVALHKAYPKYFPAPEINADQEKEKKLKIAKAKMAMLKLKFAMGVSGCCLFKR